MRKKVKLFAILAMIVIIAVSAHLFYLTRLNGSEVFPQDTYLDTETNKTALIVVAHDDDAIGCAGTVSELTKKGWKVHFLTFYGNWRKEDNPMRKKEVEQVAGIQQLASTDLIDFSIQKTDTVKEPWMPIPYSAMADYMQADSIKNFIATAIKKYQPAVIFSLDNVFGGYGHPEHVFVSQSVLDVCKEMKIDSSLPVKKIYQAVYTKTLNENVLKNNPAFIAAKDVYQVDGSPVPDLEVNIYNSSKEKKEIMLAYHSQKRNLKKIWPYYYVYPHWLYFKIFDKEYFRVITI